MEFSDVRTISPTLNESRIRWLRHSIPFVASETFSLVPFRNDRWPSVTSSLRRFRNVFIGSFQNDECELTSSFSKSPHVLHDFTIFSPARNFSFTTKIPTTSLQSFGYPSLSKYLLGSSVPQDASDFDYRLKSQVCVRNSDTWITPFPFHLTQENISIIDFHHFRPNLQFTKGSLFLIWSIIKGFSYFHLCFLFVLSRCHTVL